MEIKLITADSIKTSKVSIAVAIGKAIVAQTEYGFRAMLSHTVEDLLWNAGEDKADELEAYLKRRGVRCVAGYYVGG